MSCGLFFMVWLVFTAHRVFLSNMFFLVALHICIFLLFSSAQKQATVAGVHTCLLLGLLYYRHTLGEAGSFHHDPPLGHHRIPKLMFWMMLKGHRCYTEGLSKWEERGQWAWAPSVLLHHQANVLFGPRFVKSCLIIQMPQPPSI